MKGMRTMIKNLLTAMDIEYLEKRTKKAIGEFGIENLMDYTIDSIQGCDLNDFYKTIVEEVLIEDTYVAVSEISDGKYEVTIEFEGKDRWYYISGFAWDNVASEPRASQGTQGRKNFQQSITLQRASSSANLLTRVTVTCSKLS
jgi:hypothetical protein